MPKRIDKKGFFAALAPYTNYLDEEILQQVFYGLVRMISIDLRGKHEIILPDLGTFYIKIRPSRRRLDVHTRKVIISDPTPVVAFKPDYKFNAYIKSLKE